MTKEELVDKIFDELLSNEWVIMDIKNHIRDSLKNIAAGYSDPPPRNLSEYLEKKTPSYMDILVEEIKDRIENENK